MWSRLYTYLKLGGNGKCWSQGLIAIIKIGINIQFPPNYNVSMVQMQEESGILLKVTHKMFRLCSTIKIPKKGKETLEIQ
jgi:hypothetical protein